MVSVICYWLSVIGYRLSVIGYRLSVIGYRLSVIGYRLLGYRLPVLSVDRLSLVGYRLSLTRVSVIGYRAIVQSFSGLVRGIGAPEAVPPRPLQRHHRPRGQSGQLDARQLVG